MLEIHQAKIIAAYVDLTTQSLACSLVSRYTKAIIATNQPIRAASDERSVSDNASAIGIAGVLTMYVGANQPTNKDTHNQNVNPNGVGLSKISAKTKVVPSPAAIICANKIAHTTTPEPLSIIWRERLRSVAVIPIIITNGTSKLRCSALFIPNISGSKTANPEERRYKTDLFRRSDATIELPISSINDNVRKTSNSFLE